ncbi:SsgA family sporulation/cell division regulator [Streptomyces sp. NRRL WC-3742]|uniref:SsgA family sporulation/cell division regulator n=1 Tax=Streptomyces sp. NRRL WC-3742 TaxID=1463934 RepID=UPI000690E44F|nr:SsgA family sporulation/cell division regulator [Streptomyces sp. NRRL WC-3742]
MAVELVVIAAPGVRVPVPGCLRYQATDPYAVHLDCHVGPELPITWTFARDLLATGVRTWAGTGDVCVFPSRDDAEPSVSISLDGEAASVVLHASTARVATFLSYTARIVPFGSESRHIDLDLLSNRLCGGEQPEAGS